MSETVEASGLCVRVAGEGPGVLFLHGIGSSSAGFTAQFAGLSADFRCYAPDAPGYADSADHEALDGMDGYAAAYESLIEAHDIAAVVGVSFGGVVACRIALRGNADLHALVLADTSRGSGVSADRAEAMRRRPLDLATQGITAFACERAERLVSPHATAELTQRIAETMATAIRLPGYAHAAAAMADTDHSATLPEITCSTLVLVGELDTVCPPEEARRIAALIPGAEYAEVAGAGHLANQERPDEFNELVRSFLQSNLPSSPRVTGEQR